MTPLTVRNICAILLIVSSTLDLISNLMYTGRDKLKWFVETPTYVKWERGALIAAFVIAALGVALLEIVLREAGETILARLGATAFLIGAVVAIVAEGQSLSGATSTSALEVIMVVVLFVAEAILGAALLTSGLLPAWVGWTMVAWNMGWLIVLPIVTPRNIYFPALHFLLWLIGIMLLVVR